MRRQKKSSADSTEKVNPFKWLLDNSLRFLMMLKTANVTFTEGRGTSLPGFKPSPNLIGLDVSNGAPGFLFAFGGQNGIIQQAKDNGWLTTDTLLNTAYMTRYTQTINFRATLEPLNDFKIEVTADRAFTENHQEYVKADRYGHFSDSPISPQTTGNFSISYFSVATAFTGTDKNNNSKIYSNFLDYRYDIANRLASQNPHWDGTYTYDTLSGKYFPKGYGPTSQNVMIPAFLAAYGGKSPSKVLLQPFPKIPFPNWRITYSGLSKIPLLKKLFRSFTISHAYRSTYSVGSYITNVHSEPDLGFYQKYRDAVDNFVPQYEIGQVVISEQFAPLFKVEMAWINSLLSNFEMKRSRSLSLSFANNQLTEVFSSEYIIGLGYRIKDVTLRISTGKGTGGKKTFKSDINLKADLSIRNNKTVLRRIDENVNQVSAGQQVITINVSADYMLSDKLTFRLFFDKVINNPYISSQFKNSTTNGGISLRFTLTQ